MSVINTNISSLMAQNSLQANASKLTTTMQRLSTGVRINSANDDAAGLAISTRMDSQIRGLNMAVRNAGDGISLMQTTEGSLSEVTSMLQRMRELAVQSVNGSNSDADRLSMDSEVQQLKAEIDRIGTSTEFNNQKILDGTFTNRQLQIGDKAGASLQISIGSVKTKDLGLGSGGGVSDTLISARVTIAAVVKGDILINGQAVGAIAGSDDMEDVILAINNNVDNVKASAFNVVLAKVKGNGVTDGTSGAGFKITFKELGQTTNTVLVISKSTSMDELVSNINAEGGGAVKAELNAEGKLQLSNQTGATISVTDGSGTGTNYDGGSGFRTTIQAFTGFLQLTSKDGSSVRVERGNLALAAPGNAADLASLGFREVSKESLDDAYTTTGLALTAAGVAAAWDRTDIKINGAQIFDDNILTTSFQGKLDTINAASQKTGVTASAYFEKNFDTTDTFLGADGTEFDSTDMISINGTAVNLGADISVLVTNINAVTAQTGITAEANGANLVLSGSNVKSITVDTADSTGIVDQAGTNTYLGASDLVFGTGDSYYGSIRLDSTKNSPISIQLGDTATVAEHGFLEANVGAADFEVNAATLGGGGGRAIAGINIATLSSASEAITAIDAAIKNVSSMRSDMGAVQNRLQYTINNLTSISTNTAASRSRIMDTDYAKETSNLAKAQIISQAATAMLAQANQSAQSVLALLK